MKFLFRVIIVFLFLISCKSENSSSTSGKIELSENLKYEVLLDESYLKNPQVNSVFEIIDKTLNESQNTIIEGIKINAHPFKFTGDNSTVGGLFDNTMSGLSLIKDAGKIILGVEERLEIKRQISILHDLEKTFNKNISYRINSDLKEILINLYPLEYFIMKNKIIDLDTSTKTIELFNSNLKVNNYLIEDLVPTYVDVVKSFSELNRTVVLNKLNRSQIDSLKLQISSLDEEIGPFKNKGSIKKFKNNYLKFHKLKDFNDSKISSEIEFLNDETLKGINDYISSQENKIKKLISFLGSNDLVKTRNVLIGDLPIFTKKKYETRQSKIIDKKFNKMLQILQNIESR